MVVCYLGIGSNLGDRRKYINTASGMVARLKGTRVIKKSRLYNSRRCGGPAGQPDFLNGALKIKTGLSPLGLLKGLKGIEKKLGRAPGPRFGPRVIDIDILLYADRVIRLRDLTVPHPRMFKRWFVLKPLGEVL
ncbi:MAG: 2-amino-4-hydroxy-6-hydroxymethyldihydropteridine diphosphokinase [Candidatus Omnitrophota bacterium]